MPTKFRRHWISTSRGYTNMPPKNSPPSSQSDNGAKLRQRKLSFRVQQKTSFTTTSSTTAISTMLSQYEILSTLCSYLASADVIHLAATSREHWQYIASSKPLLRSYLSNARCDGTGVITRARLFGHWHGDLKRVKATCTGEAAKPCADCGAVVCNVRRIVHSMLLIMLIHHVVSPAVSTSSILAIGDLTTWARI